MALDLLLSLVAALMIALDIISVTAVDNNGTTVSFDQLSHFHNCFLCVIFYSYFLILSWPPT